MLNHLISQTGRHVSWLRFFAAILFILGTAQAARALEVTVSDHLYTTGDEVNVSTTAFGQVGVESDLRGTSSVITANGSTQVHLGIVRRPGVFPFRLRVEQDVFTGCLVILPEPSNQLRVMLLNLSTHATASNPSDEPLLRRFQAAMTAQRLSVALNRVARPWLAQNAIGVSSTTVVCLLPGGLVSCAISVGGHVTDLGFAVLRQCIEDMQDAGLFTVQEVRRLDRVLGLANVGAQTLLANGIVDRLITLVAGEVDMRIEQEQGKVLVKTSSDGAKKFIMLISVKP